MAGETVITIVGNLLSLIHISDKDDRDNKGDRVPPTGAAVSVVAAAAVLLTAAGVTILKRRQSGDHGSARHSA